MGLKLIVLIVAVAAGAVWVYETSRPAPLELGTVREAAEKAESAAIGRVYKSREVLLLPADLDDSALVLVIAERLKSNFDANAPLLAAVIEQHKALYVSKGDRLQVVAVRGELSQVINLSKPKQSTAAWMPTSHLIASPSAVR